MTKGEIKDVLKDLGLTHVYGYRLETRALPNILGMDEQLYGITSGVYQGKRWLAAVTGQHIYLISVNPVSKTEVKVINRGDVRDAAAKKCVLFAKITLELDGESIVLEHAAKASVPTFLWAVSR